MVILIKYRGEVVAIAGPKRVFFADAVNELSGGHPFKRALAMVCLHAGTYARGDITDVGDAC
jgi:hypothetical protein